MIPQDDLINSANQLHVTQRHQIPFQCSVKTGRRRIGEYKNVLYDTPCGILALLITKAKLPLIHTTVLLYPQSGYNEYVGYFPNWGFVNVKGKNDSRRKQLQQFHAAHGVKALPSEDVLVETSSTFLVTRRNHLHTFSREPLLSANYC